MNVLIIDNNVDREFWGAQDLKRLVAHEAGITAHIRRGPQNDLPKTMRNFDRLVVSGSKTSCLEEAPWISRLDELIRETLDLGKPFLGVCFGHQSLNRAIGGREILRRGANHEFGWGEIETILPNPLFENLPEKFHTYQSHWEEVATLPKGMRHLARSNLCAVQACQLDNRPVFGIQFHPEKSLEDCKRSIERRKREKNGPTLLLPDQSDRLYDPKIGETIFRNFLKL